MRVSDVAPSRNEGGAYLLVFGAVLPTLLVLEDAEIADVAGRSYTPSLDGFAYGASRLMGVCTVAKPASSTLLEELWEVMGHLGIFHLEHTEALDAWSVNEISSLGVGEWDHL